MTIVLPPVDSPRAELLDRLDHHLESVDDEDAAHHRDRVAVITTALAQLGDGSYGTCLGCGVAIAPHRLTSEPATSTCVGCTAEDRLLIG